VVVGMIVIVLGSGIALLGGLLVIRMGHHRRGQGHRAAEHQGQQGEGFLLKQGRQGEQQGGPYPAGTSQRVTTSTKRGTPRQWQARQNGAMEGLGTRRKVSQPPTATTAGRSNRGVLFVVAGLALRSHASGRRHQPLAHQHNLIINQLPGCREAHGSAHQLTTAVVNQKGVVLMQSTHELHLAAAVGPLRWAEHLCHGTSIGQGH